LGRGRWKRAAFLILPARGILHRQVGIPSGTSLAAYFTNVRMSRVIIIRNNGRPHLSITVSPLAIYPAFC